MISPITRSERPQVKRPPCGVRGHSGDGDRCGQDTGRRGALRSRARTPVRVHEANAASHRGRRGSEKATDPWAPRSQHLQNAHAKNHPPDAN